MFKKLFSRLTQSASDRYLQSFEQLAQSLSSRSPQLANMIQRLAALKRDIDNKIEAKDSSLLKIDDLGRLSTGVCDGAKTMVEQLSRLEQELPEILSSRDATRFDAHVAQWRQGALTLMQAHAMLHRAATGSGPTNLTTSDLDSSPLKSALDALELEITTAERIRNELGA